MYFRFIRKSMESGWTRLSRSSRSATRNPQCLCSIKIRMARKRTLKVKAIFLIPYTGRSRSWRRFAELPILLTLKTSISGVRGRPAPFLCGWNSSPALRKSFPGKTDSVPCPQSGKYVNWERISALLLCIARKRASSIVILSRRTFSWMNSVIIRWGILALQSIWIQFMQRRP